MTRPRGFTMIELAIVIALTLILMVPFMDLTASLYRQARDATLQADLKADAEGTAFRIFRRAAAGPYRLDPDNHGLVFADGSRVRYDGASLTVRDRHGTRTLLDRPLADFTAHRQDGVLTLHLSLLAPAHVGGPEAPRDYFYDWPAVGEPR